MSNVSSYVAGGSHPVCPRPGDPAPSGPPLGLEASCGNVWFVRKGEAPPTKPGWENQGQWHGRCVRECGANHPSHHGGTHHTRGNHQGACNAHVHHAERWSNWASGPWQRGEACGGRLGQNAEGLSNWDSCTQRCGETWSGRPGCEGEWAAKTVKRPPQQPVQPKCANH